MTINARNQRLNIIASSDGKYYSKYPNGNAIAVNPWYWEGLSSGLGGLTADTSHGTVVWNAGGFARITYVTAGVTDLEYRSTPAGNSEITVQYDIRRHQANGSKQLKIFSRHSSGAGALTAQQPFSYSGSKPSYTYSDNSNSGDNDCEINLLGAFRGGTAATRTPAFTKSTFQASDAAVQQDITGTVWETWKVYEKRNSDNVADGELAVWKDGVLVLHLTNMWNCATTVSDGTNPGVSDSERILYRERGRVALGAYANVGGGWYEDYRNLKIGFFRPAELP